MQSLLILDSAVTNFIFSLRHPVFLNFFFSFWSFEGPFLFVWIAAFSYLINTETKRFHDFLLPSLFSVLLSSFLTNIVFKRLFVRPRPLALHHPNNNYPSDFSFPSGHATFAFGVAYIMSHFDPAHWPIYYGVAFLIAFSRIYLGYHYVGDVVGGAVIGWVVSLVIFHFSPLL